MESRLHTMSDSSRLEFLYYLAIEHQNSFVDKNVSTPSSLSCIIKKLRRPAWDMANFCFNRLYFDALFDLMNSWCNLVSRQLWYVLRVM